jgi:hypothetical protein
MVLQDGGLIAMGLEIYGWLVITITLIEEMKTVWSTYAQSNAEKNTFLLIAIWISDSKYQKRRAY